MAAAAVAVTTCGGLLAGCVRNQPDGSADSGTPSSAGTSSQAQASTPPADGGVRKITIDQKCGTPGDIDGGAASLKITNRNSTVAEVYVAPDEQPGAEDAKNPPVVAELDQIGYASDRTMDLLLGNGTYHLICSPDDHAILRGPSFRVTNSKYQTPSGTKTVGYAELDPIAVSYSKLAANRIPALKAAAEQLRTSVASGNRSAAQRDWEAAYEAWQRLTGVHQAIENADEIAGIAGERSAASAKKLSGLHRIEWGLWHGEDLTALEPVAGELVTQVGDIPEFTIDTVDLGVRSHEITEDSQRLVLTGLEDYGAHDYAGAVAAQAEAAAELIGQLGPVLDPGEYVQSCERLRETALRVKANDGADYKDWPRAERQALNASVDRQLEDVAHISSQLELRRSH